MMLHDEARMVTSPGAATMAASDLDLLDRLALLRREALRLCDRPVRPLAGNGIGFIEAAAMDEGGLVWIVGWMRRDALLDRPVVILDSSKIAAGFTYTMMPRSDLPEGAAAFIGVLQTEWNPSSFSKPFFFVSGEDQLYLEGLSPLRIIEKRAFVEHCSGLWAMATTGPTTGLRRLLQSSSSWAPLPDHFIAEKAAVDEVLILPGFGCFAKGWALSPARQPERFLLRLGKSVLVSSVTATMRTPRPDLGHIYSGADRMVEQAGFTAALPGDVDHAEPGDAALKVVYRDGSATVHPIAPGLIRRIGQGVSVERVLSFFPAIEAEAFFPDFARALSAQVATMAQELRPFSIEHRRDALVFAAPQDRSDLLLMFEHIARNVGELPEEAGIVILASQDANRAPVLRNCAELRRRSRRAVSLVFVPDVTLGAYALPALAELTGMERFVYVADTVVLSASAWKALRWEGDEAVFFDLSDPALEEAGELGPSFECFGWSVSAWREWLVETPPGIGGVGTRPPPAHLLQRAHRVPAAAMTLGVRAPSRLVEAINAAVGEG